VARLTHEVVSMEHAKDIELIELVAKRLDAEREQALWAHLQDCPACQARLKGIARTWDLLGAWQVRPGGDVRISKAEVSSQRHEEDRAAVILRFPGVKTALRTAAAIAVTVLVGYAGGRWSVRPTPTAPGTPGPSYLSVLNLELGASFSPLVLQDGSSAGQEGGS